MLSWHLVAPDGLGHLLGPVVLVHARAPRPHLVSTKELPSRLSKDAARPSDSSIKVKSVSTRGRFQVTHRRACRPSRWNKTPARSRIGSQMPTYNGGAMAERPGRVVDYGAFQHPPSPLFRDYLQRSGRPRSPSTTAARWDLEALGRGRQRTRALARPRDGAGGGARRGSRQRARRARAAADAARLRDPSARRRRHRPAGRALRRAAVRPLQGARGAEGRAPASQSRARRAGGAGLLGRLRRSRLRRDALGRRCSTRRRRSARCATPRAASRSGQPASRIVLDETIDAAGRRAGPAPAREPAPRRVVDARAALLPPGRDPVRRLRALLSVAAARPRRPRPVRPRAQGAHGAGPVARDRRGLAHLAPRPRRPARQLLAAGYHQQVPVRPGFLNLFVVMEGERRALGVADGTVEVRGLGRRIPRGRGRAPAGAATRRPGAPGVLLRPLAQDLCCRPRPTWAARPRSPTTRRSARPTRTSASRGRCCCRGPASPWSSPRRRARSRPRGSTLADLQADPEALLARWAREAYPRGRGGLRARPRAALEREMAVVEERAGRAGPDAARGGRRRAGPRAAPDRGPAREGDARPQEARPDPRRPPAPHARRALPGRRRSRSAGWASSGLVARHGAGRRSTTIASASTRGRRATRCIDL